jgi:hypothetical protein
MEIRVENYNAGLNGWWNGEGREIRDFLSDLSGDNSFHEKLHVTDCIHLYHLAKSCEVQLDRDAENYLLKEVCGELAEQILASKHGKKPDELFNDDGNFYEPYQEKFKRLYDLIEEKLTYHDFNNQ